MGARFHSGIARSWKEHGSGQCHRSMARPRPRHTRPHRSAISPTAGRLRRRRTVSRGTFATVGRTCRLPLRRQGLGLRSTPSAVLAAEPSPRWPPASPHAALAPARRTSDRRTPAWNAPVPPRPAMPLSSPLHSGLRWTHRPQTRPEQGAQASTVRPRLPRPQMRWDARHGRLLCTATPDYASRPCRVAPGPAPLPLGLPSFWLSRASGCPAFHWRARLAWSSNERGSRVRGPGPSPASRAVARAGCRCVPADGCPGPDGPLRPTPSLATAGKVRRAHRRRVRRPNGRAGLRPIVPAAHGRPRCFVQQGRPPKTRCDCGSNDPLGSPVRAGRDVSRGTFVGPSG